MYVLVEKGIFTEVQNEGLYLKISMDPNIVLHINIQRVIPPLKTVLLLSEFLWLCSSAAAQGLQTDRNGFSF